MPDGRVRLLMPPLISEVRASSRDMKAISAMQADVIDRGTEADNSWRGVGANRKRSHANDETKESPRTLECSRHTSPLNAITVSRTSARVKCRSDPACSSSEFKG